MKIKEMKILSEWSYKPSKIDRGYAKETLYVGLGNKDGNYKFEQRPVEGHMIEFEDKAKQSLFGVVKTVGEDITEVDFNHPVAGKNITFEV